MVNLNDLRLPPHHLEAEKGTLSCALLDNEVMYLYESLTLHASDFYQKEHQLIYAALEALWSERRTIDVVTLSNQLTKGDNLEVVGGMDYLYEIASFSITPSIASEYGKIVKEKSVLRNILATCQQISGDVYEEQEVPSILERIEKRIFDLTQVNLADSLRHIKDVLSQRVEAYMEIVDHPERLEERKVNSSYQDLDAILGGFKPGDLSIIAARPSMGKTAFAINVLVRAAMKSKKSVALFSLEMGSDQIVDRILSMVAAIPMHKISKGQLDEEDFSKLGDAMEQLSGTSLYIDDRGGSTIQEMKSKLRKLKIEK